MAHVLITSLRNEGPFLLEWVAYHRAIGFDRIVVAYNDCDDGSVDLLVQALDRLGWITALPNEVPEGVAPQQAAARVLARDGAIAAGDWVIWIDLDEFVNVHIGDRRIQDLTAALGDAWGMLVPWRLFGDAGLADWTGRFIHPAYDRAALPSDHMTWAIKTLFRHGPEVLRLDIHRPYLVEGNGLDFAQVRAGHGNPITQRWGPHHKWLGGSPRSFPRMGGADQSWELAQINHYAVRNPTLWALKRLRGRGYWTEAKDDTKLRHTLALYAKMNLNGAEDRSILFWQDATTGLMQHALSDPAIAKAQSQVGVQLQATLATLAQRAPVAPQMEDDLPELPEMHMPSEVAVEVRRAYASADTILEYGSGGTTVFAARETQARLVSVESDKDWADNLRDSLAAHGLLRPEIDLRWINIGPTKTWGKPAGTAHWSSFHAYPLQPWQDADFAPDLVLIDGRFRLACFAATLINTRIPVTVLWDDYANRPEYHVAETILAPAQVVSRMARFEVQPQSYAPDQLRRMISWFFETR